MGEKIREGEEKYIYNPEEAEEMGYAEKFYHEAARAYADQAEDYKKEGRPDLAEDMESEAKRFLEKGNMSAEDVFKKWEQEEQEIRMQLKKMMEGIVGAVERRREDKKSVEEVDIGKLFPGITGYSQNKPFKMFKEFIGLQPTYVEANRLVGDTTERVSTYFTRFDRVAVEIMHQQEGQKEMRKGTKVIAKVFNRDAWVRLQKEAEDRKQEYWKRVFGRPRKE